MGMNTSLQKFGKNSFIKQIYMSVGYNEVRHEFHVEARANGVREVCLRFNDSLLPTDLDLPDLLICLAEEIRHYSKI